MKQLYEYGFVIKSITPSSPHALESALNEYIQTELFHVLETTYKDWEINSHSIMLWGKTIVLSVLLQRQRS